MQLTNAPTYFTYNNNNTRLVFIDGTSIDTLPKLYTTLQVQLSIPSYFGHNLDALEEVLHDLEWVQQQNIHFIILQPSTLLSTDAAAKQSLLDILSSLHNNKYTVTICGV